MVRSDCGMNLSAALPAPRAIDGAARAAARPAVNVRRRIMDRVLHILGSGEVLLLQPVLALHFIKPHWRWRRHLGSLTAPVKPARSCAASSVLRPYWMRALLVSYS